MEVPFTRWELEEVWDPNPDALGKMHLGRKLRHESLLEMGDSPYLIKDIFSNRRKGVSLFYSFWQVALWCEK